MSSYFTTDDPEYRAKSRYPSAQAYYDAEDAHQGLVDLQEENNQLRLDGAELEDKLLAAENEIEKLLTQIAGMKKTEEST